MRSPASLLLAILALVLPDPSPTNNGTANAGNNSPTPAAGNSTLPGGSGLTAIFFGNVATLPPACGKLVTETVQPLLLDPECEVAKFAQAALKAVSQVPECGNQLTFGAAIVAAFYGSNAYCALEQSKALEEAKVAANATADAWPQPTLLTAKCGEEWIKNSEKVELQLAVKTESGASSTGGAGTAAGADKPSGAGKAMVTVSSLLNECRLHIRTSHDTKTSIAVK
ncbi:hypothetical protein BCR44DRAFT_1430235 [Catenaria anguillulae PL171]|uniref:Uncharacterized protein n=1 Tax=Catenaria anguillulae PL171 TaxID=765915 RepID=A0A1Y2HS67_9FUNG|nr:hypothetical protein BCR44DRAFT_1430235 [Catenaria anguillulae PL171]